MTTNEEEIKKSARLRKIMQVMRKYHFVSNFYHQTNPQARHCKNWDRPLLNLAKYYQPVQTLSPQRILKNFATCKIKLKLIVLRL